jgi:hypothetical protein
MFFYEAAVNSGTGHSSNEPNLIARWRWEALVLDEYKDIMHCPTCFFNWISERSSAFDLSILTWVFVAVDGFAKEEVGVTRMEIVIYTYVGGAFHNASTHVKMGQTKNEPLPIGLPAPNDAVIAYVHT